MSTRRPAKASRIALGLSVVSALLAACATPPTWPPPALSPAPGAGFTLVALGDSYGSGQGAPDQVWKWWKFGTPTWHDKRCNRSLNAGAAQAATKLRVTHPGLDYASYACSGSTIEEGLIGPYGGSEPPMGNPPPLRPQVQDLADLHAAIGVEAVVISVGGNDIYFKPIVAACLVPGPAQCNLLNSIIENKLQQLRGRLDLLKQQLDLVPIDPSRIFLSEYPDPTHDRDGSYCANEPVGDLLGGIDQTEAQWASEEVLAKLNLEVCTAAHDYGWNYVGGVAAAFSGHGWCAGPDDGWINSINDSMEKQRHYRGGVHPNRAGYTAIADPLAAAIAPLLSGQPPVSTSCAGLSQSPP